MPKAWFDEEYSKLVDERKLAKFQWLQDPSKVNVDNFNNIRPFLPKRTNKPKFLMHFAAKFLRSM
jgi:hypothetical protein